MKDNKKVLVDEDLDNVSGGTKSPPILDDFANSENRPKINPIVTSIDDTKKCPHCGGIMRPDREGKLTGAFYTCEDCGATYSPGIDDVWNPAGKR